MEEDGPTEVNVCVAVRCRPMSGKEIAEGSTTIVEYPAPLQVVLHGQKKEKEEKHLYAFDHIFQSNSPQENVYHALGVPLLDKAMEGYNSTIFAYGQTGSGKTFTMMNHRAGAEDRGLIPRISDGLYERIDSAMQESETRRFLVCCSFMEIYNEIIFDLLQPRAKQAKGGLEVREQKGLGVYVKDLTEVVIESASKMQGLIEQGFEHRTTAATKMNEGSSRSHCIFVIKLHQKDAQDESKNTFSKLNLVDLAGSERAKSTEAEGERLKEGANINKSLSALGNVINALSSVSGGSKKVFVPYRNSKLTRVLQESLGGNSLCTMVATISPSSTNLEETLSTLNYAKRAKTIKTTATKNDEASQIKKLEEEVEALRRKLASQAGGQDQAMNQRERQEMESKYEGQISELQTFMKQSWEDKEKLSKQYAEEQKKVEAEAKRAAERVLEERRKKLEMLEKHGDLHLTLQALQALGNRLVSGWPDKIHEALKIEQTLRAQLRAVKLFRESAGADFSTCVGCKVNDAVAIITLLNQVNTKLKSMGNELSMLAKQEASLEEHFAQAMPELALAMREAQNAAKQEGDDVNPQDSSQELLELLALTQKQLQQHHGKARSFVVAERKCMGFKDEHAWLLQCLNEDGGSPTSGRQEVKKALQAASQQTGVSLQATGGSSTSQISRPLGLSTFELQDGCLAASSNSEHARCARLMQTVGYGGWCPVQDADSEYLEIDLGEEHRVLSISVQGRVPCTSEWMQTRDLLHLALAGVAEKLPQSEKVYKRPPVRLIHDVGVALGNERKCFEATGGWEVDPALLNYNDLSREQKVQFFDELIGKTNTACAKAHAGGLQKLTLTPQDILGGKKCEESNLLLQLLAYFSLFSGADNAMSDVVPQWVTSWKLSYCSKGGAWQQLEAVLEGPVDASSARLVKLPEVVSASKIRIHPVQWQHHPGIRCEVHVAADAGAGPDQAALGTELDGASLEDSLRVTCQGISEVQKGIEERRLARQREDDEKAANMASLKDKAEMERDLLEKRLQEALAQVEALMAANAASEEKAASTQTELLKMQVDRDKLSSQVEQLEGDLTDTTAQKSSNEEEASNLREDKDRLQGEVDDLTGQLQVMTEERDLARQKEEELFDMLGMKEEDLMDTNNGYVYLTERLQEKEEEMENVQEDFQQLQSAYEKVDERSRELSDEVIATRGEMQGLRNRLAEEERMHKAAQDRYMNLLKDGMAGGLGKEATPRIPTASTQPSDTLKSGKSPQGDKKNSAYEDDFDE
eukprot:TRINITY_DN3563_c1_g3_i1.p1 TRINITY_DN3563_c1_g3~~TRINITY_DN3563_c1_g3_i1.p1  ORF type:complete len:1266 (+),score=429.57 TRINITY_DN3563_c1_g3_i1:124-3921(+)